MIKKIDLYLAKFFLLTFLKISLAFSLLIFFINIFEVSSMLEGKEASFLVVFKMSFLLVPDFLNNVVSSIVLIAVIVTVFILSARSEVTIIRSSGFSLWNFIRPMAVAAFALGVFWVMIFGPISISMLNSYNSLEQKYVNNEESYEVVEPRSGIWFKQSNLEQAEEEVIISAKNVYKDKLQFNQVNVWFFNNDGEFYKKLSAEKIILKDGSWVFYDTVINDVSHVNVVIDNFSMPTNLDKNFVTQRIVTNFQNEKLFSVYELPRLIKDLKVSGFLPTKFEVYFHSLIAKPFLFVAMTLIACYFGLHSIRSSNAVIFLFSGIAIGLILYITSSIINAFGASGFIPVFAATWIITLICAALGIILIYKRENI